MTKLEIYLELFRQHHILHFNKQLVVTQKFYRDFSIGDIQKGIEEAEKEVAKLPLKLPIVSVEQFKAAPQPLSFKQFIIDCDVPEKLYMSTGSFYWANRYSEKAGKVFDKMLRDGVRYDILVIATKLYYKAGGARQAISNFILEGSWESFYDKMLDNLNNGTAEKHIKKNLQDGDEGYSRYNE